MAVDSHSSEHDLPRLSFAERQLGRMAQRPRLAVYGAVAAAAALGWLYLVAMVAGSGIAPAALGPGMQLFGGEGLLADYPLIAALCRPIGLSGGISATLADLSVVFLMWAMMAMAMMLPSAAPMLSTYAQLADTAAGKGEPAAPVWLLAAGYLAVWLAFAALASVLQVALSLAGSLTAAGTPATASLAGSVLLAAAVYQFTPAKHACLVRCRNPFVYFFGHWTSTWRGVFRIGVAQGLFCLGCCWALMTVMFAVGVMNLVWIAFLGALMVIEKTVANGWISRAIGVLLGVLALVVLAPVVLPVLQAG
jgi:predicted metal-binding membrane protein